MTILIIRITFALGVVGHAVNMYCDLYLKYISKWNNET